MMHRSNLPIQNMKTLCKHVHILRKCSINARAPGGTESMRVVQGSTVAAVPILILLSRTVLPMPHTMVSGKKESAAQSSNESCVSQESAVPPPPPGPPLGWNESAADDLQDATHVPYTRCQAKDCSCGPWERCLVGTTDWRDCLWRRSRRCMRSPPKSNVRLAHLRLVRRKLGSWREIPISTPMGVLASQSGAFSFLVAAAEWDTDRAGHAQRTRKGPFLKVHEVALSLSILLDCSSMTMRVSCALHWQLAVSYHMSMTLLLLTGARRLVCIISCWIHGLLTHRYQKT